MTSLIECFHILAEVTPEIPLLRHGSITGYFFFALAFVVSLYIYTILTTFSSGSPNTRNYTIANGFDGRHHGFIIIVFSSVIPVITRNIRSHSLSTMYIYFLNAANERHILVFQTSSLTNYSSCNTQ